MISIFVVGAILMFCVFRLVSFKFISILLLLENFNVLVLFVCYCISLKDRRVTFLIFMVVATLEVTLALVSLTRLWDYDCFSY